MIPAYCHSDDRRIEVKFDATAWFLQASNDEITDLADCDFCCDYAADAVAIWMSDRDAQVAKMFHYLEVATTTRHSEGFECHVDEKSATRWVKEHRPYLMVNGHVRSERWGPKDWSPINKRRP